MRRCLPVQAQDEADETVCALAKVHAINNAISFGSVRIDPIHVRTAMTPVLAHDLCHSTWVM